MNFVVIGIITFFGFIIFLLIVFFTIKRYRLIYGYKTKMLKSQLPELLDEKIFITSDGNRFIIYKSNFNNNKKYIYLFIHDIYGLNDWSINFIKNSSENILTFIQQGFLNENMYNKNFSYTLATIKQIIIYIQKKYSTFQIILVGEGFGCLFLNKLMNEINISQFIFVNPLLDIKNINLSYSQKFKRHFPYLCKLNAKINLNINYSMLTNNEQLIKSKKNFILKVNYLYLYQCLNLIKKFKIIDRKNVNILQSQYSVFYNELKLIKKIKNVNQIVLLDSTSQLLSSTKYIEQIFQILNK